MTDQWIEIPTSALVHRSDLPPMDAEQMQHFVACLASRLISNYLPIGDELLEEVQAVLEECGITEEKNHD